MQRVSLEGVRELGVRRAGRGWRWRRWSPAGWSIRPRVHRTSRCRLKGTAPPVRIRRAQAENL